MGFVVKDTVKNTRDGEVEVYYLGTDGYVHDRPEYADAYKRKFNAAKRIEREVNWYGNKTSETECVESEIWHHSFEIVEVEEIKNGN